MNRNLLKRVGDLERRVKPPEGKTVMLHSNQPDFEERLAEAESAGHFVIVIRWVSPKDTSAANSA